jgi:hypothetical protein
MWRDGGYAVGGLLVGWMLGIWGQDLTITFIGLLVLLTGLAIGLRMRETHRPMKRQPPLSSVDR